MKSFQRCLSVSVIAFLLPSNGSGESLPTANVEWATITTDAKGNPSELVLELRLQAEFRIVEATLLYGSATSERREYPLHLDANLRYKSAVPFSKHFEYQVRVSPEQGPALLTAVASWNVDDVIGKRPSRVKKFARVTVVVVVVAVTVAVLGIGLAFRR